MGFKIKAVLIVFVVVIIITAVLLVTGVFKPFEEEQISGELIVWDIAGHEPLRDFFYALSNEYPEVAISYVAKNPSTYEAELIDALASGAGPDIYYLPSERFGAHRNKIFPLSGASDRSESFLTSLPDAAKSLFMDESGAVLAAPWSEDTLALFYNRDHLNAANIPNPPKTWEELASAVQKLKRISPLGTIQRAGIAMGLIQNVQHGTPIISALVLQTGNPVYDRTAGRYVLGQAVNEEGGTAASALKFYSEFANPKSPFFTWNSLMTNSRDSFATEKASFYIGFASDLPKIESQNAHLNLGVAPLPQIAAGDQVSFARFDMFTVSRNAENPGLAWTVLSWLTNEDVARAIASRMLLPPAHRALTQDTPPHRLLSPFYLQILAARTWEIPDQLSVDGIFAEAIDQILRGGLSEGAAGAADVRLEMLNRR